ncbi:hypothetical protein ACRAWF_36620 [Streptomyces sp. L7]
MRFWTVRRRPPRRSRVSRVSLFTGSKIAKKPKIKAFLSSRPVLWFLFLFNGGVAVVSYFAMDGAKGIATAAGMGLVSLGAAGGPRLELPQRGPGRLRGARARGPVPIPGGRELRTPSSPTALRTSSRSTGTRTGPETTRTGREPIGPLSPEHLY